jgi:hypothetical protein
MSNSKDESLARYPTIEIKEEKFIGLPLKIKETFFCHPLVPISFRNKKKLLAILRFFPNVKFHR